MFKYFLLIELTTLSNKRRLSCEVDEEPINKKARVLKKNPIEEENKLTQYNEFFMGDDGLFVHKNDLFDFFSDQQEEIDSNFVVTFLNDRIDDQNLEKDVVHDNFMEDIILQPNNEANSYNIENNSFDLEDVFGLEENKNRLDQNACIQAQGNDSCDDENLFNSSQKLFQSSDFYLEEGYNLDVQSEVVIIDEDKNSNAFLIYESGENQKESNELEESNNKIQENVQNLITDNEIPEKQVKNSNSLLNTDSCQDQIERDDFEELNNKNPENFQDFIAKNEMPEKIENTNTSKIHNISTESANCSTTNEVKNEFNERYENVFCDYTQNLEIFNRNYKKNGLLQINLKTTNLSPNDDKLSKDSFFERLYSNLLQNIGYFSLNIKVNFNIQFPGLNHKLEICKIVRKVEKNTIFRFSFNIRSFLNYNGKPYNILDLYHRDCQLATLINDFLLLYIINNSISKEKKNFKIKGNAETEILSLFDAFKNFIQDFSMKYKSVVNISRGKSRNGLFAYIEGKLAFNQFEIYKVLFQKTFERQEYKFLKTLFPEIQIYILDVLEDTRSLPDYRRAYFVINFLIFEYEFIKLELTSELQKLVNENNHEYTDSSLLSNYILNTKTLILLFYKRFLDRRDTSSKYECLLLNTFLSYIKTADTGVFKLLDFDEFLFVNYFFYNHKSRMLIFIENIYDKYIQTMDVCNISLSCYWSDDFIKKLNEFMFFIVCRNQNDFLKEKSDEDNQKCFKTKIQEVIKKQKMEFIVKLFSLSQV